MIELTLICKFGIYIVSSIVKNHFFPTKLFVCVCVCVGGVKESRMFYHDFCFSNFEIDEKS